MPLSSSVVGATSEPRDTRIDERWTMAYAAALGHADDVYMNTLRDGGVIAHPLFPVCVEWTTGQAIAPPRRAAMTAEELRHGVHYAHDLVLHRALPTPLDVRTTSCVVGVRRHRAGALLTTRMDGTDTRDGAPCWTTWMTSLFRGVAVDGDDVDDGGPEAAPMITDNDPPLATRTLPIAATAAHVYTECARIWNPIHTDAAVARAAGLPGIILHGTATLALAVSSVLDLAGGPDPASVKRISGRFSAMVTMPNTLTVRLLGRQDRCISFDVCTADGSRAVTRGLLEMR